MFLLYLWESEIKITNSGKHSWTTCWRVNLLGTGGFFCLSIFWQTSKNLIVPNNSLFGWSNLLWTSLLVKWPKQVYLIRPSGCVRCHGNKVSTINSVIGPSGCVRCHGNKESTINGVILSSLFSLLSLSLRRVTFLPEGVIIGFQNFAWGFN